MTTEYNGFDIISVSDAYEDYDEMINEYTKVKFSDTAKEELISFSRNSFLINEWLNLCFIKENDIVFLGKDRNLTFKIDDNIFIFEDKINMQKSFNVGFEIKNETPIFKLFELIFDFSNRWVRVTPFVDEPFYEEKENYINNILQKYSLVISLKNNMFKIYTNQNVEISFENVLKGLFDLSANNEIVKKIDNYKTDFNYLENLYNKKKYEEVLSYLKDSYLWQKLSRNEFVDGYDSTMQNRMYQIYAHCYNESSLDLKNTNILVINEDGSGMYKNIQTAINKALNFQKIYLTEGIFKENRILVKNKNIVIETGDNSKAVIKFKNESLEIRNSFVQINNVDFETAQGTENRAMVEIENSTCTFYRTDFYGKSKTEDAISILDNSFVELSNLNILGFFNGIYQIQSNLHINNIMITNCNNAIFSFGLENKSHINAEKLIIQKCNAGILNYTNSDLYLVDSEISNNNNGIIVKNDKNELEKDYNLSISLFSTATIKNSKISNSKTANITASLDSAIFIENVEILNSKNFGVFADENAKVYLSNCTVSRNKVALSKTKDAEIEEDGVEKKHNSAFIRNFMGMFN